MLRPSLTLLAASDQVGVSVRVGRANGSVER